MLLFDRRGKGRLLVQLRVEFGFFIAGMRVLRLRVRRTPTRLVFLLQRLCVLDLLLPVQEQIVGRCDPIVLIIQNHLPTFLRLDLIGLQLFDDVLVYTDGRNAPDNSLLLAVSAVEKVEIMLADLLNGEPLLGHLLQDPSQQGLPPI